MFRPKRASDGRCSIWLVGFRLYIGHGCNDGVHHFVLERAKHNAVVADLETRHPCALHQEALPEQRHCSARHGSISLTLAKCQSSLPRHQCVLHKALAAARTCCTSWSSVTHMMKPCLPLQVPSTCAGQKVREACHWQQACMGHAPSLQSSSSSPLRGAWGRTVFFNFSSSVCRMRGPKNCGWSSISSSRLR